MSIDQSWLRTHRSLIIQCLLMFALTALATGFLVRWRSSTARARGGYNFTSSQTDPASGPKIGERIDVALFKSPDGKTLEDEIRSHQLTLAVVVDPHCGACAAAKDQITIVREAIAHSSIYYCVMMLPNDVASTDYLDFAASIDLKNRAFVSSATEKSNSALATMVIPSHLLMDSNGTIVQKWTGTDRNQVVRQRMANQIVADALKELTAIQSPQTH